jgi:hypothetical protein
VLLLVLGHPDDGAVGAGQQAEPGRDHLPGPRQRGLGLGEHLVAGREAERRVRAEAFQDGRKATRPEDATAELDQLAVNPLDLEQPDPVDVLRREVERGVDADQGAVGVLAPRQVADARRLVRPGGRQDLVGDDREIALEAGKEAVAHGRAKVAAERIEIGGRPVGTVRQRRREERQVVDRPGQRLAHPVDRLRDRGADGDPSVPEAGAEIRPVLVEPPAERGPASDHRPALLDRRVRLEGLEVQGEHRWPFERVDRPRLQPGIDLRDLTGDLAEEGVAGHGVRRVERRRVDGLRSPQLRAQVASARRASAR